MKIQIVKQIVSFPVRLVRFAKRALEEKRDVFLNRVSGVIHIGANVGQEKEIYAAHNLDVIWIEPIPEVFSQLKANLQDFPRQQAFQYLITDCDDKEYTFHIASNQGLSSSILELGLHKDVWSQIYYEKTILLKSIKLTSLVKKEGVKIDNYDALIMDTQGSELLVLKGAESLLSGFKFIKTEAADFEVYEGCCQIKDIADFLGKHGFREVSRKKFASRVDGGGCYDIVYKRSAYSRVRTVFGQRRKP